MNLKTLKIISLSIVVSSTVGYTVDRFVSNQNISNVSLPGPTAVKMDFGNLQDKLPSTTSEGQKLFVQTTFIDKNNNTWVATNGGLYMKTSADGPFILQGQAASGFRGLIVTAMYQDSQGTIWFTASKVLGQEQEIWYLKETSTTIPSDNFQNMPLQPGQTFAYCNSIINWPGKMLGIDPGNQPAVGFLGTTYICVITQNAEGQYIANGIVGKGLPGANLQNLSWYASFDKLNGNWTVIVFTDSGNGSGLYYADQSTPVAQPFVPYNDFKGDVLCNYTFVNGNLVISGIETSTNRTTVWVQNSGSLSDMTTVKFTKNYLMYPDGTYCINTRGFKDSYTSMALDSIHNRLFIGTNAWNGGNPQNYSSLFVVNNVDKSSISAAQEVVLQNPTQDEFNAWNLQTAISGIALDKEGNPYFGSSISNAFWQFPKIPSSNNSTSSGLSGGAIAGIVIGVLAAVALLGYGGYKYYPQIQKSITEQKKGTNKKTPVKNKK